MLSAASSAVLRLIPVAVLLAVALAVPGQAATSDEEFAPLNRPGPELSVSREKLATSLVCTPDVVRASRAPVLLLSGTGGNNQEYYPWNWEPALDKAGIPWCTSDVQDGGGAGSHNVADMQIRGEYITYAIRTMHKMAGRKISILGHSQGGSVMRWSLRFWPDTRRMVDDVIGLEGANHGAVGASLCTGPCPDIIWQLRDKSRFNAAMNSYQETFAGISYTTIRSDVDAVLFVSGENTKLHGPGDTANLRTQDKCPLNAANHGSLWFSDAVAEAYVLDALNHSGPADLSRIDPRVCRRPFMSGLNPLTDPPQPAPINPIPVIWAIAVPTPAEPPLACYTLAAGCR